MLLKIAVENGIDHRSIAWALDYPGCYADGPDASTAIVSLPQIFLKYCAWVGRHAEGGWLRDVGDFDVRLVESYQTYFVNKHMDVVGEQDPDGYEVDAFFHHDWKPLIKMEIQRGMHLFRWSRADLLTAVEGLTPAELDADHPGERRSIRAVMGHVAHSEWWYLTRLGLTDGLPFSSLPPDTFEQLASERARLEQVFPDLAGSLQVTGVDGELWSPRKLLRYALWHELDHVRHIYKLRFG
jgi:hypothetical protein